MGADDLPSVIERNALRAGIGPRVSVIIDALIECAIAAGAGRDRTAFNSADAARVKLEELLARMRPKPAPVHDPERS